MHPGIAGRISTPVGSNNTHSRRHSFTVLVAHTQLQAANLFQVMPLCGIDASSRTPNDLLDTERGIALFVADVANQAAVGRKACLGTIELTEGQRQWCRTP